MRPAASNAEVFARSFGNIFHHYLRYLLPTTGDCCEIDQVMQINPSRTLKIAGFGIAAKRAGRPYSAERGAGS